MKDQFVVISLILEDMQLALEYLKLLKEHDAATAEDEKGGPGSGPHGSADPVNRGSNNPKVQSGRRLRASIARNARHAHERAQAHLDGASQADLDKLTAQQNRENLNAYAAATRPRT